MSFRPIVTLLSLAAIAGAATAANYHVAGSFPGPDGGWDLASVDPVSETLFVARSDSVSAFDLKTGRARALAPAGRGHAALALPGSRSIIVTNGSDNSAAELDGATGALLARFPTGKNPDAAAYDSLTRRVFVMTPGSGDISVIDPWARKLIGSIKVGGSLELGVADGRGSLFVNIEDQNRVAKIDTRSLRLIREFALPGCDGPTGIAYAADSRRLVSACANGVAVISTADGATIATLPIGKGADGAVYDEQRKVALVPAGKDGNLSVLSLSGVPRVLEVVPTAVGARTIALDPTTGIAYLPTAERRAVVGSDRPQPVPGTFRILIVQPRRVLR